MLLPLQEGTLTIRETSLPLKKHKNDESRTVNVPPPLCINHHPSRTVEKKKKERNLTSNRCETAIDGSRSIGIFTHQTYRSIKIPIEWTQEKKRKTRVERNGVGMERHARRRRARETFDDDARTARRDGQVLRRHRQGGEGYVRGIESIDEDADVTRRGVNDLIRLIERCSIHAAHCL